MAATHIDIIIPCTELSTSEIPRVLLNLQTFLETTYPEPLLVQLTHNLDTNITIQQKWTLSNIGNSHGGNDMFTVCPPDAPLYVSRLYYDIHSLHEITIEDISHSLPLNTLTMAIVSANVLEHAHNITTRRKYGVKDNGGSFIGNDTTSYHRQRYLSWLFTNLDSVVPDNLYGCQLEIREYLPAIDHDRRTTILNSQREFRVILRLPIIDNQTHKTLSMLQQSQHWQLLLHRLCYICKTTRC